MTPIGLTPSGLSDAKSASLERAKQLAATLLLERGEASGALVARQLHDALGALDASDRHGFQRYLATEFQPDKAALRAAAERYLADGTVDAAAALAQAADPPRQVEQAGSALRDRIFCKDLLDPLERLLSRSLRRHSVLHDVNPSDAPSVLVPDLGVSWIECPELRKRRAE
jgi:hypothetical protein